MSKKLCTELVNPQELWFFVVVKEGEGRLMLVKDNWLLALANGAYLNEKCLEWRLENKTKITTHPFSELEKISFSSLEPDSFLKSSWNADMIFQEKCFFMTSASVPTGSRKIVIPF